MHLMVNTAMAFNWWERLNTFPYYAPRKEPGHHD
jgi:hypothetical protein